MQRRLKLHHWILIAMILAALAGLVANELVPRQPDGSPNPTLAWIVRNVAETAGQIFLRLIFMIALPLVFCALSLGVAGMGDVRQLGRIGLRSLLFTLVLSSASVGLGIGLVQTVKPGEGLPEEQRAKLVERFSPQAESAIANARKAKDVRDTLLDIIPKNPLQEAVGALDGSSPGGGMLAVMFFALVFGVAITLIPPVKAAPVVAVLEGIYEVVLVVIRLAMSLAPIGVAGLVFALTALLGLDILKTLGWYVVTVLTGLSLHVLVVYSIVVSLFAGMSPLRFFSRISEAMLTAFATSSSSATLPTALRVSQENLGLRRNVSSFVLTVGATANQNGTALYEGVTVLFLAQVFGVDLSLQQQILVVLMSILAGIGTAGIPGGSLPLVVLVLQSVGIPGEGIGIILGIDRLLDMSRTVVNVTGDIAIAACVNQSESSRPVDGAVARSSSASSRPAP